MGDQASDGEAASSDQADLVPLATASEVDTLRGDVCILEARVASLGRELRQTQEQLQQLRGQAQALATQSEWILALRVSLMMAQVRVYTPSEIQNDIELLTTLRVLQQDFTPPSSSAGPEQQRVVPEAAPAEAEDEDDESL